MGLVGDEDVNAVAVMDEIEGLKDRLNWKDWLTCLSLTSLVL